MNTTWLSWLIPTLAALPLCAGADTLYAVRPEPMLVCMIAQQSTGPEAVHNGDTMPRIYEKPSAASQAIGLAGIIVLVKQPLHAENGFVELEMFNRQTGWIEQNVLAPYHNTLDPKAKCLPSLMNDGQLGLSVVD